LAKSGGIGYGGEQGIAGAGHELRALRAERQEALDELDVVERANADHTKGEVELTYDADRVTEEDLREAIEEAGYTLQR
jgi:cation transport ATPase